MSAGRRRPRFRALTPGTPPNRLLRFSLGVLSIGVLLVALRALILTFPFAADIEIPLRAADRWVHGDQPYLASSFDELAGPDLPFLYPPFVLPLVAPLLGLPRDLVHWTWLGLMVAAGAFACHRLRVPVWFWPILLAWAPFAEGIVAGNVQVLLFALFTFVFFRTDVAGPDFHPVPRDSADPADPPDRAREARLGIAAAIIPALKLAEVHPWLYLLVRRPIAALIGFGVVAAVVVALLPLTGITAWFDWLDQIRRAADPNWQLAGISLGRYVPGVIALGVTIASLLALVRVPRDRAGLWVGVLAVVGAPSLHTYGLLFLLPAALAIRREVAIVAAMFISTYTELGFWIGIVMIVGTMAASTRVRSLAEPVPAPAG